MRGIRHGRIGDRAGVNDHRMRAGLRDQESDDGLRQRVQSQGTRSVQVLQEAHRESRRHSGDRSAHPAEINHEGDEKVRAHAGDRDSIGHRGLEDQDGDEDQRVAKIPHQSPTEPEESAWGTGDAGREVVGADVLGAGGLA